jgi:hypothetical protein
LIAGGQNDRGGLLENAQPNIVCVAGRRAPGEP